MKERMTSDQYQALCQRNKGWRLDANGKLKREPKPKPAKKPAKDWYLNREKDYFSFGSWHIFMPCMGKARPVVGNGKAFMPPEYVAWKAALAERVNAVRKFQPPEGPIALSITVVAEVPQSWSKAKKAMAIGGSKTTVPDLDNCGGAIMDALFADDSRIWRLEAQKVWGWDDKIVIGFVE